MAVEARAGAREADDAVDERGRAAARICAATVACGPAQIGRAAAAGAGTAGAPGAARAAAAGAPITAHATQQGQELLDVMVEVTSNGAPALRTRHGARTAARLSRFERPGAGARR